MAILTGLPLSLPGNGMRLPSQDAFATGRGEAFVATADNPSAVYYNPAGISQSEGGNIRLGLYGIYLDPGYTPLPPANTNSYEIEEHLAAIPQFFATYAPKEMPLSFGLGVYAPFGAAVAWPQDTGFRSIATEGELTYLTFNPVLALKLAPNLSIGAGATANYSKISLEQGLLRNESPFDNSFRFVGDGWNAGLNAGLLWKPHPKFSFGASFRSSGKVMMEGHTEIEQQPIIQRTEVDAQAEFTFPLSAVAGVSFRPTPKWNIEFDAEYTEWSCFDTVLIEQKAAPPFPVRQDIPVTLAWQDSWMYKFGLTHYFENEWHVSAGYVFNENSVPDDYYSPLVADMDRHFFSVGAGCEGRVFSFDLAYQFGYGPDHTVTGSTPSSTPGRFAGQTADGTYDFLSHALIVTVGFHF